MIQKRYQTEIDGLRALAIVAVLFFHFDVALFSGGYVGVDIFFVISGFLITQNIMVDIQKGSFSFAKFYLRRMRRLFPALFVTWLGTILFGYLLFTPEHFERLGKSLLYSLLSVSNFFFWNEAGYFDTTIDFKPLLHTWSLAVEEQFYFVWPAILLLLSKLRKTIWLILFIIISSAISLYWTEKWLVSDPSGAFFLAPFRIIEFAIGAILVWLIRYQPQKILLLELVLLTGLTLILYSIFSFDKNTMFPGINSLIPCIGAGLAIYSGHSRFSGWILRNRISIGIGLISYSLYLLVLQDQFILFLTTFLLATLSYFFVEQPVRKGGFGNIGNSPKVLIPVCISLAIALIATSAIIIQQAGFPQRISSNFSNINDTKQFHIDQYGGKGFPFTGDIGETRTDNIESDVIITGDSFVLQYATGLDQFFKEHNMTATVIADYACIIGPDITFFFKGQVDTICTERNNQLTKSLEGNNTPLILSLAWTWYRSSISDFEGNLKKFDNTERYQDFLIQNLQNIRKKIGLKRQFIIIGMPPGSGNRNGVISCLNRPNYLPNNCLESMVFQRKNGNGVEINQKIKSYVETTENTYFLDPFDVFCDQDSCHALDSADNKIWYSDGSHISIDGSIKAIDYFSKELIKIFKN